MKAAAQPLWGLRPRRFGSRCCLSAAGAVYCKFRARQLFIQLEQLSTQRDNLDIQWGQLQLEQSAWSTHALVESVAGKKLHMTMPPPKDIVIVHALTSSPPEKSAVTSPTITLSALTPGVAVTARAP